MIKSDLDLGSMSEETDLTNGVWGGKFTQFYSHIALILAALRIDELKKGYEVSSNPNHLNENYL